MTPAAHHTEGQERTDDMTKMEATPVTTQPQGIAAALAKAQTEMGKALKQANNPHFRSKYADLGNVMDACMPALNDNGIAVIQPIGQDEHGTYVETVLLHISGEELRSRVPLIIGKPDMQGFGSAVTYARRYGLMAMAGIAPEDDDGNAAAANPKREERRAPTPAPEPLEDMETFNAKVNAAVFALGKAQSVDGIKSLWATLDAAVRADAKVIAAGSARKAELSKPMVDDEIPY
jgi:hypothetical protein